MNIDSLKQAIQDERIVITLDDCQNLKNYSEYFGVSLFPTLTSALDAFIAEQTFKNQVNILREFCLWITTHPHETFKDPLWEKPKQKAQEFLPELMIDHEIDKMIETTAPVAPSET